MQSTSNHIITAWHMTSDPAANEIACSTLK